MDISGRYQRRLGSTLLRISGCWMVLLWKSLLCFYLVEIHEVMRLAKKRRHNEMTKWGAPPLLPHYPLQPPTSGNHPPIVPQTLPQTNKGHITSPLLPSKQPLHTPIFIIIIVQPWQIRKTATRWQQCINNEPNMKWLLRPKWRLFSNQQTR